MKDYAPNSPCYWPWISVVVDSQGYVKPCCIMSGNNLKDSKYFDETFHIDTIDHLEDYLYSNFTTTLRNELVSKKLNNSFCQTCHKADKLGHIYRHHQSKYFRHFPGGEIKFLEVTASNICNQTCITCNSYFSTKWATIEHLFGNTVNEFELEKYSLSQSGIEKIKEVMPGLEEFVIKGGEPFSDIRNAQMLEHLIEVNNTCKIHITSNVSLISKKYINIFKKINDPKRVELHGSLDHIGKKYEWIRGTSFNQTLQTVKRLYEETGISTHPTPTVSYFNVLDLEEIKEFYSTQGEHFIWFKENFEHYNHVYHPIEMSAIKTRTQKELDTLNIGLTSEFDPLLLGNLKHKIEIMNDIRGFRWQDC